MGGWMQALFQDRLLFSRFRILAIIIQAAAVICLTPLNHDDYVSRVGGFVALSAIAWLLNLRCRQTNEYRRRVLARQIRAERCYEILSSILGTGFAVSSFIYLQFIPTWPVLMSALLFGGFTGYTLTTA
jgi:hypothetical protein